MAFKISNDFLRTNNQPSNILVSDQKRPESVYSNTNETMSNILSNHSFVENTNVNNNFESNSDYIENKYNLQNLDSLIDTNIFMQKQINVNSKKYKKFNSIKKLRKVTENKPKPAIIDKLPVENTPVENTPVENTPVEDLVVENTSQLQSQISDIICEFENKFIDDFNRFKSSIYELLDESNNTLQVSSTESDSKDSVNKTNPIHLLLNDKPKDTLDSTNNKDKSVSIQHLLNDKTKERSGIFDLLQKLSSE